MKTLKKKQKEFSKKHTKDGEEEKSSTEEEDSDLASIARELQDEEDSDSNMFHNSPFIKRPEKPKVRHYSDNTTPLPEKEFSFISSSKDSNKEAKDELASSTVQAPNTSKALDQFMKFDRKYATIKAPKQADLIEDTDESEPIIPEEKSSQSPIQGKSRLRRHAEQAGLKLTIPKKSAESTTSEVSDHLTATPLPTHSPRSPKSPLFTLENLHDIEELMDDFPGQANPSSSDKNSDVRDNYFKFEPPPTPLEKTEVSLDDEAEDVIVTEDDVDEELIEIDLSLEQQESVIRVQNDKEENSILPIMKDKPTKTTTRDIAIEVSSSSLTSSSTSTLKKERRRHKHRSKSKGRKERRKGSSKSCYYCDNVRIGTSLSSFNAQTLRR